MNETLKCIKSRRSCRKYLPDQIRDEELHALLEAGLYAPSGMGRQSPILIATQDKEVIAELSKINTALWNKGKDAFFGAPTVISVLSNPDILHTYQLDAMASVCNILLAAEALGLGAACISRAKPTFETEYGQALLRKLGINEGYVGVEHVIVGYRDGATPEPPARKEGRVFIL